MSTDFFSRQDQARKNTARLLACLVLGILALVGTTYVLVAFIWNTVGRGHGRMADGTALHGASLWDAGTFLAVAGLTTAVVLCASCVRTLQLKEGGGAGVAEGMGGREIPRDTVDHHERKLLNVVEEMAIAAGAPMPRVFVMDDEDGINAFAAGWTPDTAVIGVTRGAVARLSRDELQGVIGHEFSHIVNGDMRMNIRLMGLIFGLVVLVFIGRLMLEIGSWGRSARSDRGDKRGDPRAALALIGIALLVMGWLGSLFGRLMQAAISRQREFLADASAVQFTRNPAGLAGALKQIGAAGSEVSGARAREASHMFFGDCSAHLLGLFATHPPLEERIRRLDPAWDGVLPRVRQGDPDAFSMSGVAAAMGQDVPVRRTEPSTLREWAASRAAEGGAQVAGGDLPLDVCADEAAFALSVLARCSGARPEAVAAAFAAGASRLNLQDLRLVPAEECRLSRLDSAMEALAAASPEARQAFLAACAVAVGQDERTTPLEAQLLRAYAAMLGVAPPGRV